MLSSILNISHKLKNIKLKKRYFYIKYLELLKLMCNRFESMISSSIWFGSVFSVF